MHELLRVLLLGEVRLPRAEGPQHLGLEGGDRRELRELTHGHAQAGDRHLLAAAGGADEGVAAGAATDGRAAFLIRGYFEARPAEPVAAFVALDTLACLEAVRAKGDVALKAVLDAVLALAGAARALHSAFVAHD